MMMKTDITTSTGASSPGGGGGISWLCIVGVLVLVFGILVLTRPTREADMSQQWVYREEEWFQTPKPKPAPPPKQAREGTKGGDDMVYVMK